MVASSEKTHAPTARRIAVARQEGRFPTSRVLATALALLVALVALEETAPAALGTWILFLRRAFAGAFHATVLSDVIVDAERIALAILAPPLVALFAVGCLGGLVQSGGRFLPAARRRRSLARVSFRDGVTSTGRVIAVSLALVIVVLSMVGPLVSSLQALHGARVARVLGAIGVLGRHVFLRLAIAALFLGLADYLWQRHAHAKALRMSPEELKREQRETEGEPLLKAERRRIHSDLVAEGLDVANATLLVTCGGLAVAIRYDGAHAPYVVAKARGSAASRLLVAARAKAIPVSENSDIVLALFASSSDEVPRYLYDRLAELFVEAGALTHAARGLGSASLGPC